MLHVTLPSACPGLTVRSRTDLRSVRMVYYTEQAQYLEPQDKLILFYISYSHYRSISVIRLFGYIDIN